MGTASSLPNQPQLGCDKVERIILLYENLPARCKELKLLAYADMLGQIWADKCQQAITVVMQFHKSGVWLRDSLNPASVSEGTA